MSKLVAVIEAILSFTGSQWCRGIAGAAAEHFAGSTSSRDQWGQVANTAGVLVGCELP